MEQVVSAIGTVMLGAIFIALGTSLDQQSEQIFRTVGIVAIIFGLESVFLGPILLARAGNVTQTGSAKDLIDLRKEHYFKANPRALILEAAVTFPLLAVYVGMLAVGFVFAGTNSQGVPLSSGVLVSLGCLLGCLILVVGRRFFSCVKSGIILFHNSEHALCLSSQGIKALPAVIESGGFGSGVAPDALGWIVIPWEVIQNIKLVDSSKVKSPFANRSKIKIYRRGELSVVSLRGELFASDEQTLRQAFKAFCEEKLLY
jgi:hypothetical protein